jgi:hypothetical protein
MTIAASNAAAQAQRDTTSATRALINVVSSALATSLERGYFSAVVIDPGRTAWGASAARDLRSALPMSAMPRSDTAKYYAMQVRLDSLRIVGNMATGWATWSLCIERRLNEHMNWWENPTEYSLARADSGWVLTGQRVLVFVDGHCDAYPGRR